MSKVKIIFLPILLVIILLAGINYKLIHYGYVQAKGQLHIIWNSVPLEEVILDPDYPDSLKSKLRLIEEVKMFAVQELGLKGIDNYTTFYDQKGETLLWVVSACEPFELKSYQWGFPVLGKFSYKGFFIYEMAVDEVRKLKKKGYDTRIRTAGGWSTLGILKDPVLSNMLRRDTGELADLIVHELTHGTIFIKDSIEFNENLASFIGNAGARLFLSKKFGEASNILLEYEKKLSDNDKFTDYVLKGAERLDSLYNTFTREMRYDQKLQMKQKAIYEFTEGIRDISFFNDEYQNYFKEYTPDNTFFMSFLRYRGGQEVFEEELEQEYDGDLNAFIENLKLQYGR